MTNHDEETRTWDEFYSSRPSLAQQLWNLAPHAPLLEAAVGGGGRRLLEVGVGTGSMSLFLASLGYEVTGVDNDKGVLERARVAGRAVPALRYEMADAFALTDGIAEDSFDAVFSQGFFEHFSDDDIRRALDQQLAVAPRVVFSVPSWFYPQRDMGNERLLRVGQWRSILASYDADVKYYSYFKYLRVRPLHILAVVRRSAA